MSKEGSLKVAIFSRKYAVVAVCVAALAVGACSGSSNRAAVTDPPDPPAPPTPETVSLPEGHGLAMGETSIPAGETIRTGAVDLTCEASTGSTACKLIVTRDPVTGLFSAESTGGTVMAMLLPPPPTTVALPEGHGLAVGTTSIPAGETIRTGSVDLTCTGSTACTLIVTRDGATSTGGTVTAMLPPPTPETVRLPEGHGLAMGETSIPAGETIRTGAVDLTCEASTGSTACKLTVTRDVVTGLFSAASTGGTVTAMLPPPPPTTVALPEGHGLAVGTTSIPAGETIRTGSVDLTCTGSTACTLIVTRDGATSTGGTVTAMLPPPTPETVRLPEGHGLAMGETSIPAGETIRTGAVDLTCEASTGSTACKLTVTRDVVTGLFSAASTGGTVTAMLPPPPPTTVSLPSLHGLNEDNVGTTSIPAGETIRVGGVDLTCTGSTACTLIVTRDGDTGLFSATSTGGAVTAMLPPPTPESGFSIISDLGTYLRTLFDEGGEPETGVTPTADAYATSFHVGTAGTVDGKLVIARTPDSGTTDVTVTLNPVSTPTGNIYTGGAGGTPTGRSVDLSVQATGATEWTARDRDIDRNSAWSRHTLTSESELSGSRTLHVDLHTDYDLEAEKAVTDTSLAVADLGDVTGLPTSGAGVLTVTVATDTTAPFWQFGVADTTASNTKLIPENVIVSALQSSDSGTQEMSVGGTPIAGSWKGIPGNFTCDAATGGNCFIRKQVRVVDGSTVVTVTYGGQIRFTPDADAKVIRAHTNWLAAGTWLVVPDDPEAEGEVGAFVHGADPFTASLIQALTGEATYTGDAFGRYAESDGESRDAGRFTATATLMADFDDASTLGTIGGALSAFSSGSASKGWSVELGSTDIGSDGRFDDEVSGRGTGGHVLDGLWAGQFFGNGEGQPRSVGGTFNAGDRDGADSYSLTLIGAFTARRPDAAP